MTEDMYKKLFIATPVSIIVTDSRGNIMFMNEYAKVHLNENSFPLIGTNFCDLLSKSISDFNQKLTLSELLEPANGTLEYWFRTKNGNTFYAELKHNDFNASQKTLHLWLVTKLERKQHLAYEL